MHWNNPWVLLAAGLVVSVAVWVILHYFSPGAKLERRRRRNNYRVQPKVRRPMVRLSVRTQKRKRRTKG